MTIRYVNYRREFPQAGPLAFRRWLSISRYFGGKQIHLSVKHRSIVVDLR